MSATYASLHYHIVFSTKGRRPYIRSEWRNRLHKYMGGTIEGLGGFPEAVGGVADHVHILVGLKPTHSIAYIVCELKKASGDWIRHDVGESGFRWQSGYSVFTVSASVRKATREYIGNQEVHHRKQSSREELIQLLSKSGVSFDENILE